MRNVLFPQPTVGAQSMHTGERPLLFLLHVTSMKTCQVQNKKLSVGEILTRTQP